MKTALRFMMPLLSTIYISASAAIINIPADYPTIQQGNRGCISGTSISAGIISCLARCF